MPQSDRRAASRRPSYSGRDSVTIARTWAGRQGLEDGQDGRTQAVGDKSLAGPNQAARLGCDLAQRGAGFLGHALGSLGRLAPGFDQGCCRQTDQPLLPAQQQGLDRGHAGTAGGQLFGLLAQPTVEGGHGRPGLGLGDGRQAGAVGHEVQTLTGQLGRAMTAVFGDGAEPRGKIQEYFSLGRVVS